MKIKTITCHNVYNYGASLQAYALQHYLEELGHEVEIINYTPWYLSRRYNPMYFNREKKSLYTKILCYCLPYRRYHLAKNYKESFDYKTPERKKAFDLFTKIYLRLTETNYTVVDELQKNPPLADLYIAGSDQIWNTTYCNGKDPAFYLDFGDCKIRRSSYAASIAVSGIDNKIGKFIKNQLKKFDAISVREKTGVDILKSLGIDNVTEVLDPVFLLSQNYWNFLSEKGQSYDIGEHYILLYDFICNDEYIKNFTLALSQKYNMEIIAVADQRVVGYADRTITNAGPLEFLSLIRNADYVVSNSFHATVFSVIFQKNFYTFSLKTQNNSSRMADFLSKIGAEERLNPVSEVFEIDYSFVSEILQIKIEQSKNFIKDIVE